MTKPQISKSCTKSNGVLAVCSALLWLALIFYYINLHSCSDQSLSVWQQSRQVDTADLSPAVFLWPSNCIGISPKIQYPLGSNLKKSIKTFLHKLTSHLLIIDSGNLKMLNSYFSASICPCVLQRLYHGAMQFSDMSAGAGGESQPYYLPRVEEEVEISDSMAVISVPPPRFRPGDPAYILHDFNRVTPTHWAPHMIKWICFKFLPDYFSLWVEADGISGPDSEDLLRDPSEHLGGAPPSGPHRPLLTADGE